MAYNNRRTQAYFSHGTIEISCAEKKEAKAWKLYVNILMQIV